MAQGKVLTAKTGTSEVASVFVGAHEFTVEVGIDSKKVGLQGGGDSGGDWHCMHKRVIHSSQHGMANLV